MPVPLDEYPIHQVPLSMQYVATSDRNCYDRCIFHAFQKSGEVQLITGLGLYPNLGVIDAYAVAQSGDGTQRAVRASDALGENRMDQKVGPFRIEVIEPLERLRIVCDGDAHGVGYDLMWQSAFPAVEEPAHITRAGNRVQLDACRFCQTGTWEGVLRIDGKEFAVDRTNWSGTRDRSWGIRPVGEADPPGRYAAEQPTTGFWWVWAPIRFDDFAIIVIAQEKPDGHRVLTEAVRVWPNGTEQLGWPEVEIQYRSGTRHPERAAIHLSQRGKPLTVEVQTLGFTALNVGAGYGADPDWSHGQWRGRDWVEGAVYDLTDPKVTGRIPYSVIDHVGHYTLDGADGYGIFEHACIGQHDPSGFTGFDSVAP